ncbi:2-keto-4-pentenoate hydratase/2-oxohepta-3-ene-1,7-dioic acid hydratase (catechol pathway) [Bryocella elongata]|uniref:2-keto-4-pentenoate hydratase/2-oxohepta-3-ene-1,7-dioic acid hydratase (Catechol pathway) n=1 Tax=Bryocella elongata TaxID=863522 RepID=A0A1H6C2Z3_9BACT|nr:fumarylacetoacetate hydrolase family protein [Bryocella elongata]SEG67380.1 2-keto-4-pentenoate hydratase/2-oxohepta-3-ene-1,7-dioic acid hydratase (catechol pathway) [Bryocella elongata]
MKLGIAEKDGRRFVAASVNEGVVDLTSVVAGTSLRGLIETWSSNLDECAALLSSGAHIEGARWCAPLPDPPKFLLLAGNFRAHVVESGYEAAPEKNLTPQFFMKPATTILDPEADIPLVSENVGLDYEAELAVVMGKRVKNATLENALEAVWGYTVVNDISERKLNSRMQPREKRSNDDFFDWLVGKWFDGSAPMGPWVTTSDEMSGLAAGEIVVSGYLNGEEVQRAPITAMIHSVAEAIVYISRVLTLEPGDVIAMGTPAGVGLARGRLLQDGDEISCEVTGIGVLRNRVRLS